MKILGMNYLIARVSDPKQLDALLAQRQKLFDYAEKRNWIEKKDFIYAEFDEPYTGDVVSVNYTNFSRAIAQNELRS